MSEASLWLVIYRALWAAVASLRRRDETEKARSIYLGALLEVAHAIALAGKIPPERVAHEHRSLEPPTG